MSQIIERGSPAHNEHLIGIERDRLITESQPKIIELREKLKVAKQYDLDAVTTVNTQIVAKRDSLAAITAIENEIYELENPKVSRDVLSASREARLQTLDARRSAGEITPAEYQSQRAVILAESKQADFSGSEKGREYDTDFQNGVVLAKNGQPLAANSSQATKDGFNSVSIKS
jgi:hypothetical protein